MIDGQQVHGRWRMAHGSWSTASTVRKLTLRRCAHENLFFSDEVHARLPTSHQLWTMDYGQSHLVRLFKAKD